MLKWLVNSGWWLENRHSRESRKPRCCLPGLRAGIGFGCSESLQCLKKFFRVILSCHSRPTGGNPYRSSRRLSLVFSLSSLVILSACTDYVSQIEDRYGEWNVGQVYVPAEVTIGSITDSRDGQSYKTVSIGTQTWMAQNLNYETANSYCYSNTPSNCTKYGRLYTWAAAMDSAGTWSANGKGCGDAKKCTPTYPVRGVCPTGWHLPTKAEFETLFTAVGGSRTAVTKLKSTSGWNDFGGESGNGVDAYSFSALPAGYRGYNEDYNHEGFYAYFWSSTEDRSDYAYDMYLYYGYGNAYLSSYSKYYGFSVRCVKDDVLKGISSSSVELKSSSSNKNVATSSSNGAVKSSSSVKLSSVTDSRDGQSYKTVVIGTQTWMAQNLNYETANSYCYGDSPSNCTKYGRLYTWAAAMDSAGIWSANGKGCGYGKTCSPTYPVRGVCPTGWHLPTKAEFETLFTAVGGSSTAGTKLKSTSGWNDFEGKSGNGVDAYSFSALPAGDRNGNGGYFNEGNNASFWSSTEYSSYSAYYMYLYYGLDPAGLSYNYEINGFSVRCVMD